MEYKILNDKNRKYMINGINNDLNFEWEDTHLLNQIIRKIDDIYPYSSDPQEFIDDIVWDNNNFRPSYALNYKTPIDYKTQLGFK